MRSICIRIGVDISGKRRRIVVDDDVVFNRFSASCSRRSGSVEPDSVWTGVAIDDLNGAGPAGGKPTV